MTKGRWEAFTDGVIAIAWAAVALYVAIAMMWSHPTGGLKPA